MSKEMPDRIKDEAAHAVEHVSVRKESHAAPPAELTPEEQVLATKLRRKIDALIMPTVIAVYLLNWIDRYNYAAARLQGLEEDLQLTPAQYQIGLSILYVGYILAQVPSNMLLNWFGRPSLYVGFFCCAWGTLTLATAAVHNFAGIAVCRFILGMVEAPLFPGILFYLSKWYTKSELNFRMSLFFSAAFVAGAFGNLIAAGILGGLDGVRGLAAWKWLYIIEGAVSILVGMVTCLILPDFPETWKSLPDDLKTIASRRMFIDAAAVDLDEDQGVKSQIKGFKQAFTDLKVYILALIYMCITTASGFQNFFPTLTATLGYSRIVSLLLVAPPFIFVTLYNLAHSLVSDRLRMRFWFVFYPIPVSIIGFLVFMFTDDFAPRYFSVFLIMFCLVINCTLYSWIASSIPRPPAKRAVAYAFINAMGNSASIWTPFTYRDQDTPHFRLALGVNAGMMVVSGFLAIWLYLILRRENRKLEEDEANGASSGARADRQLHHGFRYVL